MFTSWDYHVYIMGLLLLYLSSRIRHMQQCFADDALMITSYIPLCVPKQVHHLVNTFLSIYLDDYLLYSTLCPETGSPLGQHCPIYLS